MIIHLLRRQLYSLFSLCHTERLPFLRRFNGDNYLFISDLPMCVSENELKLFFHYAKNSGWSFKKEEDYILLDPVILPELPARIRKDITEEEECCLFLLSMHQTEKPAVSEIREYLKVSEQKCTIKRDLMIEWQKEWSEKLRNNVELPGHSLYEIILYDQPNKKIEVQYAEKKLRNTCCDQSDRTCQLRK